MCGGIGPLVRHTQTGSSGGLAFRTQHPVANVMVKNTRVVGSFVSAYEK
jgi:hypothetical protein